MRQVLSPQIKIKASGGIYTLDYALELIEAGADQLGMSQGEQIVNEFRARFGGQVEL
jgi:deoxyribose-phosphate aldolase